MSVHAGATRFPVNSAGVDSRRRAVARTRAEPFSSSVTSRPLKGDTPSVDLVLGYKKSKKSNQSPILNLLLSRLDELVARVSNETR